MTIIGVNTLDNRTLDIQLASGSQILLEIGPLIDHDPAWAALRGLPLLPRPDTDGEGIFWPGGPRITLAEILKLLAENSCDIDINEDVNNKL